LVFLRSVRRLLVTAGVVPSSPIVILMKEALSSSETSLLQEPHGLSQKLTFFIVTAVKTSNLTEMLNDCSVLYDKFNIQNVSRSIISVGTSI
jgi:hypothetical protein